MAPEEPPKSPLAAHAGFNGLTIPGATKPSFFGTPPGCIRLEILKLGKVV